MPELLLPDVPPRLMSELREWAALRRVSVEHAAMEMIRVGLQWTRDEARKRSEGLDVDEEATEPDGATAEARPQRESSNR